MPDEIVRMAHKACGVFGKQAVFEKNDYTLCPLSHPIAAVFACVADPRRASLRFTPFRLPETS